MLFSNTQIELCRMYTIRSLKQTFMDRTGIDVFKQGINMEDIRFFGYILAFFALPLFLLF